MQHYVRKTGYKLGEAELLRFKVIEVSVPRPYVTGKKRAAGVSAREPKAPRGAQDALFEEK